MITMQPQPTTFHKFSSHAINFDNLLHANSKNYGSMKTSSSGSSKATTLTSCSMTPWMTTTTTMTASNDMVLIEINAVCAHQGPLTTEERQHHMDNRLCTYCGNSGHFSNICPNKSETTKKCDAACTTSST
jgi:hypothetical protein